MKHKLREWVRKVPTAQPITKTSPIQTGILLQLAVERPQRERKPNVRYSAEENKFGQIISLWKRAAIIWAVREAGQAKGQGEVLSSVQKAS